MGFCFMFTVTSGFWGEVSDIKENEKCGCVVCWTILPAIVEAIALNVEAAVVKHVRASLHSLFTTQTIGKRKNKC